MREEIFPIVDEDGNVVGQATRSHCHDGSMLLHPVVHLHVVSCDKKKLYLQRRALTKKIQPGAWDTAVGGHVDYGEAIWTALLRESREELGIDASGANFVCKYVFQSTVERELVHVFHVELPENTMFHADPAEVIDSKFWSIDEINSAVGMGVLSPNFESEFEKIVKPLIFDVK